MLLWSLWSLRGHACSLGATSGYLGHSSNVYFDAFNPNVSGQGIRRLHAWVRAGLERSEPTLCVGHCHSVASRDLGDLRGVRLQAPDPQRSGDTTIYGGATSNRGCDSDLHSDVLPCSVWRNRTTSIIDWIERMTRSCEGIEIWGDSQQNISKAKHYICIFPVYYPIS